MADKSKAKAQQDANRIAEWLVDNRAEFEQSGISEDRLTGSLGMSVTDEMQAVDYLENRDEVVRWPQAQTTPPRFLLKPGRIWPKIRDAVLVKRPGGQ
ncbi:MAG: hypothetical protein L0226_14785 [Acidobacteria bacterium]|nr:hypothetical protein [Acidobacteriota bacterium]